MARGIGLVWQLILVGACGGAMSWARSYDDNPKVAWDNSPEEWRTWILNLCATGDGEFDVISDINNNLHGRGHGDGLRSGHGCGDGSGDIDGSGCGYGDGYDWGFGCGSGDGHSKGDGSGHGDGTGLSVYQNGEWYSKQTVIEQFEAELKEMRSC